MTTYLLGLDARDMITGHCAVPGAPKEGPHAVFLRDEHGLYLGAWSFRALLVGARSWLPEEVASRLGLEGLVVLSCDEDGSPHHGESAERLRFHRDGQLLTEPDGALKLRPSSSKPPAYHEYLHGARLHVLLRAQEGSDAAEDWAALLAALERRCRLPCVPGSATLGQVRVGRFERLDGSAGAEAAK